MDLTAAQMIMGAVLLSGVVMVGGWLLRIWAIYMLVKHAAKLILILSVAGAGGAAVFAPEGTFSATFGTFFGG